MAFVNTRTGVMLARCFCLVALIAALGACATAPKTPPVGAEEPDKFLYEHGSEGMGMRLAICLSIIEAHGGGYGRARTSRGLQPPRPTTRSARSRS